MTTGGKARHTNALAKETSPYLLQHAHNPVEWRAWNEASLAEARAAERPIFLSIGYSTCHWCHVMEEESFEDEEIAAAVNAGFIPIKVDREERPDVDGIYMTAVQALTGHGGWPMSVFLTPDLKPFFAGTYFPARDGDRGARMGFLTLVKRLDEAWRTERDKVAGSANEITAELAQLFRAPAPTELPALDAVDKAVSFFASRYDDAWGGLLPAPKFPSSLPLRVLLRHHARTGDERSLDMVATTFLKMADGGLYDQVGGGFHRYSTDERWLVPHFEKMLYDNALLVLAGLELFQITKEPRFAAIVRDVLAYIAREMTSPDGAFYSATDADSLSPDGKREEGWFFTWTPAELKAELGDERAKICARAWAVTERGNFEGRSILWRPKPVSADDERVLAQCRPILLRARGERPPPLRDDKILAAWNGLMISAFARAAFALDEPSYAAIAVRAARFVLDRMRAPDGRLFRTYKDAPSATVATSGARHAGTLDDHAFVLQAALDVYESTGDARFLDDARALERVIAARFADEANGGYFLTPDDGERLLAREKPAHDGAEPSGNSVHALNLARLAAHLDDAALRTRAESTVRAFGQILQRHPAAMAEMLLALELLHAVPREIVVVSRSVDEARALLAPVRAAFLPNRVIVQALEGATAPLAAGRVAVDGKPTVYVCERRACKLPATTVDAVTAALA